MRSLLPYGEVQLYIGANGEKRLKLQIGWSLPTITDSERKYEKIRLSDLFRKCLEYNRYGTMTKYVMPRQQRRTKNDRRMREALLFYAAYDDEAQVS